MATTVCEYPTLRLTGYTTFILGICNLLKLSKGFTIRLSVESGYAKITVFCKASLLSL